MEKLQKKLLGEAITLAKGMKPERDNEMTKYMLMEALFAIVQTPFDADTVAYLMPGLETERKALYEKCQTCAKQCGGSEPYDVDKYLQETDDLSKTKTALQEILLKKAKQVVSIILTQQDTELLCGALAYLGKKKHITVEQGEELISRLEKLY